MKGSFIEQVSKMHLSYIKNFSNVQQKRSNRARASW